jgi:hypothetical protein
VSSPRDVLCEARWCSQLGVPFWLWSWGYCDRPHGEGVANMEDTVTVRAKISPCFGAECVQEHWSTSTSEDNAGHLVILLGRHVIVGIIVVTRHGIMIQSPTTLLGSNRHCSARIDSHAHVFRFLSLTPCVLTVCVSFDLAGAIQ